MQIKIKPERSKTDHMYKIGTWIRDNTQGIGTMTYVKGTSFGGLGHGIYDMDTGTLLKIKGGLLLDPQIYSIKKENQERRERLLEVLNTRKRIF